MTKAEFIELVKAHMKNNKNSWFNEINVVDGHNIGLKLWMDRTKASIHRMEIDGLNTGGIYEMTQKKTIEVITDYLNRI